MAVVEARPGKHFFNTTLRSVGAEPRQYEARAQQTYSQLFPNSPAWDTLAYVRPGNFVWFMKGEFTAAQENVAQQETFLELASRRLRERFSGDVAPYGGLPSTVSRHRQEKLVERANFPHNLARLGLALILERATAYPAEQVDMIPQKPREEQLRQSHLLRPNESISGYGFMPVSTVPEAYVAQTDVITKIVDLTRKDGMPRQDITVKFAAVVDAKTQQPKGLIFF